jgi:hypothetical protein
MKSVIRVVVVALLASLIVPTTVAQETDKAKKRGRQNQAGLFSFNIQRAVPGIDAAVKLTRQQRQKIAALRKEILNGEKIAKLRKKSNGENASKEDKQVTRKAVQEAQGKFNAKSNEIVGEQHAELIAKINAAAREVQSEVRSEYRQQLKDARGDEEAAKKLQKEITAETAKKLSEKISSMLSDEQKEAVAKAAKREAKRSRAKRREKKEKAAA